MKKLHFLLLFGLSTVMISCYDDEDDSLDVVIQEEDRGNANGTVSGIINRKTVFYEDYIHVSESFPNLQRLEIRRNSDRIVFRFPIGDTGLLIKYSGRFENYLGAFNFFSGRAGRNFHIRENDTLNNRLLISFNLNGNILDEDSTQVGEFDISDGIIDINYQD